MAVTEYGPNSELIFEPFTLCLSGYSFRFHSSLDFLFVGFGNELGKFPSLYYH